MSPRKGGDCPRSGLSTGKDADQAGENRSPLSLLPHSPPEGELIVRTQRSYPR